MHGKMISAGVIALAQYFSAPPNTILNQTIADANAMMSNYNRIISDGNTVFNNFANTISAVSSTTIPSTAILPFNLSACPSGWVVANGTGGTPDLRGYFIQIVNTGPGGTFTPSALLAHTHPGPPTQPFIVSISTGPGYFNATGVNRATGLHRDGVTGNVLTGAGGISATNVSTNETRPRNVALIYCMKS